MEFYTQEPLDKNILISKVYSYFSLAESENILWLNDYAEIAENPAYLKTKFCIIADKIFDQGYCYRYIFHGENLNSVSVLETVEFCKNLAIKSNQYILTSDESINPYSWVLVETDGLAYQVYIDEDEEESLFLVGDYLGGYVDEPFGIFLTERPITDHEISLLSKRVLLIYTLFGISDIQSENNIEFNLINQVVNNGYYWIYSIVPNSHNLWIDQQTKTTKFIEIMKQWQEEIQIDICILPADYWQIVNVKGGTDSCKYCIEISDGYCQQIEYKSPKDWD